jgi:2'-5' RNA ligase
MRANGHQGTAEKGIRSFVAAELPGEIIDQLGPISQKIAIPGVRLVDPKLVHVTLKFLGDVPSKRIGEVTSALGGISFPEFRASVSGIGAFPGKSIRVVWLGVHGEFAALAKAVDAALFPLGYPCERSFKEHATLARVKDPSFAVSEEIKRRMAGLSDLKLGEFTVDRFFLKKSTLTRGGPIYENQGEFLLRSSK